MHFETVILGAGAAGMMCAAQAGADVLLLDHAKAPGEKIRISGGGRCNFTNLHASPENFLSGNPHFHKSALARFSQWDFIEMMDRHGIAWHEKTLGQLFCDDSAKQIIRMLLDEMGRNAVTLWLQTSITEVTKIDSGFRLQIENAGKRKTLTCRNLVLATGGKSIPKMGATGLAYDLARQFGLAVTETRPALVPLTFADKRFADISGVSLPVRASAGGVSFDEALLFTHRGLSGPAILQISSYWREGMEITLDLAPGSDLFAFLRAARQQDGRKQLSSLLAQRLPARLVEHLAQNLPLKQRLADQSDTALRQLADALQHWQLRPGGSEGYRTAEVTLGGVDCAGLSSKTMMAKTVPGLYVIGEAVDVTGWLGGFNFQWAWSSGHAAGVAIREG